VAFASTIASLSACRVTESLSRGKTATTENNAPLGFQHLVQPQAWLYAVWALSVTSTVSLVQWHTRVPPSNPLAAGLMPLSTDG
jgi:hypothetical protein